MTPQRPTADQAPRALVFVVGDGALFDPSADLWCKFPLPFDPNDAADVRLLWHDDLVGLDRKGLCAKCVACTIARAGASKVTLDRPLGIMPSLSVGEWLRGRQARIATLASEFEPCQCHAA